VESRGTRISRTHRSLQIDAIVASSLDFCTRGKSKIALEATQVLQRLMQLWVGVDPTLQPMWHVSFGIQIPTR
jgi:hypothetical protein